MLMLARVHFVFFAACVSSVSNWFEHWILKILTIRREQSDCNVSHHYEYDACIIRNDVRYEEAEEAFQRLVNDKTKQIQSQSKQLKMEWVYSHGTWLIQFANVNRFREMMKI